MLDRYDPDFYDSAGARGGRAGEPARRGRYPHVVRGGGWKETSRPAPLRGPPVLRARLEQAGPADGRRASGGTPTTTTSASASSRAGRGPGDSRVPLEDDQGSAEQVAARRRPHEPVRTAVIPARRNDAMNDQGERIMTDRRHAGATSSRPASPARRRRRWPAYGRIAPATRPAATRSGSAWSAAAAAAPAPPQHLRGRRTRTSKLVAMGDVFKDRLDDVPEEPRKVEGRRQSPTVTPDTMLRRPRRLPEGHRHRRQLVILATPPGFRPMHLEAAVDAGKHIFTEKPVAVDGPGIRTVLELHEEAKQKNLAVVAGTQRRHHSKGYLETMKRIHDGAIGDIVGGPVLLDTSGDLWFKARAAQLDRRRVADPQLALLHLAVGRPHRRAARPQHRRGQLGHRQATRSRRSAWAAASSGPTRSTATSTTTSRSTSSTPTAST